MKKLLRLTLILAVFGIFIPKALAISFNLDSIAEWGKFPRFAVNTYRWGDHFFNGYDTTYVVGTGYKFNTKIFSNTWNDGYLFTLPESKSIFMLSRPSTSLGVSLTYMAVTASYDINISKIFADHEKSRKRLHFGFSCMLFSAEAYYIHNTSSTLIRRFGAHNTNNLRIPFHGIDNESWGLDAYYFINHKRYSEAASFNFSRIQKKSQGSFFAGFSYQHQNIKFDFRGLPPQFLNQLPSVWPNYTYVSNTDNYSLRFGYGYNWVFKPGWVLGISESPVLGFSRGTTNSLNTTTTVSMYNRLKGSVVWNNGRWFAGVSAKLDITMVSDQSTTYAGGDFIGEAVFGCRFNLW